MKNIFIGFLLFCNLAYGQTNEEVIVEYNRGLLWEISDSNNRFYLFGSLHSNEKSLFNFSDSLYHALYNSDLLILESDILSITYHATDKTNGKSLKVDEKGKVYSRSKKPSNTGYGNEDGMPQFIDAYFQNYANTVNLKIKFLESINYQVNLINEINSNKYLTYKNQTSIETKLKTLYVRADIHKIDNLLKSSLSHNKTAYNKLIVDRNIIMTDSILKITSNRNAFCIVGVGHLGGKEGMLELLKRKGFKIRAVRHTISSIKPKEKESIKKVKKYYYVDSLINLRAEFPGKPNRITNNLGVTHKIFYNELGQGNSYSIEIIPHEKKQKIDDLANIYISNPAGIPGTKKKIESGELIIDGVSDTYLDGLHYIRIIQNDRCHVVIKASGGNKFMSSKRYEKFFGSVWLY